MLATILCSLFLLTSAASAVVIPQSEMSVHSVSGEQTTHPRAHAIDNFPSSHWRTQGEFPHSIVFKLGDGPYDIDQVEILPRQQDEWARITGYAIYVNLNGEEPWGDPIAEGVWTDGPELKIVNVGGLVGQFVKIEAKAAENKIGAVGIAEFTARGDAFVTDIIWPPAEPVLEGATLAWGAPKNTDGIVGYKISAGISSGDYNETWYVEGVGTTTLNVDGDITVDRYYIVQAWGGDDDLSDPSNELLVPGVSPCQMCIHGKCEVVDAHVCTENHLRFIRRR